jgi:hypothetical protein
MPESTVTFNWHAYSSPPGATFSVMSGSIDPGGDSPTITVTDPFICPMAFVFEDTDQHLRYIYVWNGACR